MLWFVIALDGLLISVFVVGIRALGKRDVRRNEQEREYYDRYFCGLDDPQREDTSSISTD